MEKGKISSLQMAVMLYPTIVATAILEGFQASQREFAKTDFWLFPYFGVPHGVCDGVYRL